MSALYDPARGKFAKKQLDWLNDDIRAILVDLAQYSFSAAHEFLSSVPSGARVAVSPALTGKTVATNGACGADTTTFVSVAGPQVGALILYQHTGSDATASLIAYIDQGQNLPLVPSGGNVQCTWATTGNRIFRL